MLDRVLKKKVNIEKTSFHSVWKIDSGSEWFGLLSTTIFVIRVVHNISMTDIAVDKSTDLAKLVDLFFTTTIWETMWAVLKWDWTKPSFISVCSPYLTNLAKANKWWKFLSHPFRAWYSYWFHNVYGMTTTFPNYQN